MADILMHCNTSNLTTFSSFAKTYVYLYRIGPDATWEEVVADGVATHESVKLCAQDKRVRRLIKLLKDFLEARKGSKIIKEEDLMTGPTMLMDTGNMSATTLYGRNSKEST
jgi:hypothetical protein